MRLAWEGLSNARDLGGVPLLSGGRTKGGSYIRSDHPGQLTSRGWDQLRTHGVRTIISLETAGLEGEAALHANRPVTTPADYDISLIRIPVEDATDAQFVDRWIRTGLWSTPLYFAEVLTAWPTLYGDAINTIAHADGPSLIHCGRGHDRTGIITLVLLALAGATVEGITNDYLLSAKNLLPQEPRSVERLEQALQRANTSAQEAVGNAVSVINESWLSRAHIAPSSVQAIQAALIV